MRIAVIGAGISGNLAARLLSSQHDVMLYESGDQPGGHANTVSVTVEGRQVLADTGFMVFNHQTYPNFCRLLEMLNVASRPSDMSFSVCQATAGWEYQGSSLNGLFAQRSNLIRLSFYKLLWDILRFNRAGTHAANAGSVQDDLTVGQFLDSLRLGRRFQTDYLLPMASAIWSSSPLSIRRFPARFLIGFLDNHGLMQVKDRPQWRTIVDGSQVYVSRLLEPLMENVRLSCPVQSVLRTSDGVLVTSQDGQERYDHVVLATHADTSLRLLSDPSPAEKSILGSFPYQASQAVLHRDESLLPKRKRAWASWNYRIVDQGNSCAVVTYDLNRLQCLGLRRPLLLTLGDSDRIDPH
ncbi:MAG TPA: FAD-dependent oxidoreductase, partial [Planctomycetaceae bacterium]|nr:FAD-dependent oxidoreductase [Planctomycetaceae bacterium]